MLPLLLLATLPVLPEPAPAEMLLRVDSEGVVFQGKTISPDLDVSEAELAVLHGELSALRKATKGGNERGSMGTLVLEISDRAG